jgi:hypothetical protein
MLRLLGLQYSGMCEWTDLVVGVTTIAGVSLVERTVDVRDLDIK